MVMVSGGGSGLKSLVLGPFGPDLGPDLDLTWDLDLSLTIIHQPKLKFVGQMQHNTGTDLDIKFVCV